MAQEYSDVAQGVVGGCLGWLEVVPGHPKALRGDRRGNGPKNLQILRFRHFSAKLGSLKRPYLGQRPRNSKRSTDSKIFAFWLNSENYLAS